MNRQDKSFIAICVCIAGIALAILVNIPANSFYDGL